MYELLTLDNVDCRVDFLLFTSEIRDRLSRLWEKRKVYPAG